MGVPKFFRWMSERYPCLSEIVKEYQIPEFDNLYLDMNGIIHPCSHPDDSNPHFRITEETIFNNIFHYIEVLFRMIRPKKVFFMAVDGVAPRAKMNQQRGRRFRSVREAQDREREARNRGEVLPTEKRFDSNCITPGTGFMVRLNAQLRYFVARKISTDPLWQGIRVILSGHDVPGEGEHKVMEFIRYEKSLPDYDHNTRHCLYGLDADLIVLGLCTHEPHFSLLREEVLFTKQQTKRTTVPEEMTFYLLHLSLFREYLGYEFSELEKELPFKFDLERIIDDWVMLGFLVGNDFVPHLPNLHIRENALPTVYRCYKQVLPTLDGYINDGGTLVLERFEALMQQLAQWELDRLEDKAADQRWLDSKRQQGTMDIRYSAGKPRDKKSNIKLKGRADFESFAMFDGLDGLEDGEELEPSKNKSVFSEIHTNIDDELLEGDESVSELEYRQQRRHYYQTKMDVDICPEEALRLAVEYVRAIQWILHYYYDGVCSWSWFYPSHYAPYIGDVRGFSAVPGVVDFEYGRPFLPYEQLLAVLPAASQDSLPECLRPLMTSPQSPIIDYYPETFETDLNGKTQDWEAVVLIPFIDQERLLAAIRPLYDQLTPEEAARNVHGDAHLIEYTAEDQGRTESPGYFPPLRHTFARVTARPRDPFIAERRHLRKGLLPGARLDVLAAGFPTLRHVPHSFHLARCKVKVFQQASMGENMMLTVRTPWGDGEPDAEAEARRLLGRVVFVQWPHLTEATVVSVATPEKKYSLQKGSTDQLSVQPLSDTDRTVWIGHMHDIKSEYEGRRGILTDDIPVLVYAKPLTGRKHAATPDGHVVLQKQWSTVPKPFALQTCVRELKTLEGSYTKYTSVADLFDKGSHCFVLAPDSYASMGKVIEVTERGRVRLDVTLTPEPDFSAVQRKEARLAATYFPGYVVAQKLGITSHLVSRLTGCLLLEPGGGARANGASNIVGELEDARIDRDAKFNCAIEIKHNKKNEEMPGYSRRKDGQWMYSGRLIDVLREYMSLFPELIEFLGRNTEGFKFKEGDIWPEPEI
ncbi:5'-3' exoribonuclease 1-like, partial [Amphibalanus amphitrite]|uniref:5'-3' exoribonuclease 1-like n=1 Tax=Amphibalanus amphitrite TaxID=1232801 RepID=UPI001C92AEDF